MLDNLVTPIVAIAVILGITFPIWLLVLLARFVQHVGRIADALSGGPTQTLYMSDTVQIEAPRRVSNSMFGR